MKKSIKGILCLLFAVVLVLCIATAIGSREVYASGTKIAHGDLYASDLEGYDSLYIDGNTHIHLVDGDDISLKCIRLDYNNNGNLRELIIEGSNAGTLRITGSAEGRFIQTTSNGNLIIKGGHVIIGSDDVSSSTMIGPGGLLQMEDGILEVKGNRSTSSGDLYGINVERLQMFSKAILNVDVTGNGNASAVVAQSINLSGGHVILNAYTSGTGKSANGIGTASSTDGTIGMSGGYVSINANAPYGSGYGIYTLYNEDSRNYLTLDGGSINIYGSAYGIHTRTDNDVNIAGSAAVTVTAGKNCALLCGGNLDIRGQAVLKASVRSTSGQWSTYGTVYSKDYAYINPYTSKIVTPAGGKITEQMSGDEYVCSFITDSLGNKAQNVVVGPITNNDALAANIVAVGGGRRFASDRLYYVNGADSTTGFTSDWNAHYEPETGTLYLRNYEDRSIYVNDYNKRLTIDLSGTNTITKANAQFGIDAVGNDLEITSVSGGTLSIIGDYQNSNGAGSAAIATNWSGTHDRGTITISGDAVLNIDTGSNEEIDGITAEKDLVIKDHAKVDVKIFYGDDASACFYGMGAKGSITITTDRTVNVSIYSRDSWSSTMSRSIYALWPFNFRSANGDSRFDLLNAEYVSFAYVGKPNEGYVATSHLMNALENGLVPDYGFKSFEGNDAQSFILSSKGSPSGAIPVVSAYFPDPGFCAYVADQIDKNKDGWLTQTEMNNVIDIDSRDGSVSDNAKIHSLAGIEWFPNNKWLAWGKGNIRTLDLSVNGKVLSRIELIGIDENPLETIDLSGISELKTIQCWDCKLSELDVSDCSALQQLFCENNTIASLDLTGLTALEGVTCENNGMGTLTLGSHPELYVLSCYKNSIPTLDISGAPLIEDAYLNGTHTTHSDYESYSKDDQNLKIDKTTTIQTSVPAGDVTLKSAYLSLEGKISINFKVQAPDAGYLAKLYYEKAGFAQVAEVPLDSDHFVHDPENYDYYLVTYSEVPAKEMNQLLRIKMFDAYGNQVPMKISSGYIDQYDYSVAKWCTNMINKNTNANDVMIAKALLNYGHYSQLALKYNDGREGRPDNMPAAWLEGEMSSVTANSAYDRVTTGGKELGAKSFILVLESDTLIKLLLSRQVSVKIDGVPVTLAPETDANGNAVWAAYSSGVAAKRLHELKPFALTEGSSSATMYYGCLSWANSKLSNGSEDDQNLARAMYLYNYAARRYFNYDAAGL